MRLVRAWADFTLCETTQELYAYTVWSILLIFANVEEAATASILMRLLRHPAHLHVRIAVVLQDRFAERPVDQAALAVAADGAHEVVLDRVLVGVELERPAHRVELRRTQRLAHRVLIFQLALDVAHRRIDQQGGVVPLRRKHRRHAFVFVLELGHELLVRRVREIGRPVRRVEQA